MSEAGFDPGGFYEFHLREGSVRTHAGQRVLVLSDSVVGPLITAAVEAGDLTPIRKLGRQLGDHARTSLGRAPDGASPESVAGHASATLALFGWGRLRLERWGHAIVAAIDGLPELDPHHLGIAALLGGLFSAVADREVACVPVDDDRFVLVDPSVAEDVWELANGGLALGAILDRLAPAGNA